MYDRTHTTLRRAMRLAAVLCLAVTAAGSTVLAQAGPNSEPVAVDADMQEEIIDSVTMALNQVYVFPDVAAEMEKHVRRNLKNGDYKEFTTVPEFANALTEDLREISHDLHLRVRFLTPEEIADMPEGEPTEEELQKMRQRQLERMQRNNFAFKKIEILPGNVGYLRFDGFDDATFAGSTAIAALNFLAHCDAVIIDLRQNGGGSPSMIQLISSYFLEEPTHLNSFYIRQDDTVQQFWTQSHVVGPRMVDTDLYVLTSGRTFSAAEEFTYNMKNLERATIVGETTGGGAHPVEGHVFPNVFIAMSVPFGRAINPITGTNWEGTGVAPDIEVPAPEALDAAYLDALTKVRDKQDDPRYIAAIDWASAGVKAKLNPVVIDSGKLARYAGTYEDRILTVVDGALVYQRGERPPMRAIPMSQNLFHFDEIDYFRLEVVTDTSGQPIKLIGHYDNGQTDESIRSSKS